jgi:uncharacterized protein YxjI
MHEILNRNVFYIKEHLGIFKAANNYDILDPDTEEILINCREEHLGFFTKLLRFTDYKRMTPFNVELKTPSGEPVLRVSRGISLFLSKVSVNDETERQVGGFKQKLFSIGGKFDVLDANEQVLCQLKGNWRSREFNFIKADGSVVATVDQQWAGLAKEMFTSADNYILRIDESVPPDAPVRVLILAAVMCIDMVLKE